MANKIKEQQINGNFKGNSLENINPSFEIQSTNNFKGNPEFQKSHNIYIFTLDNILENTQENNFGSSNNKLENTILSRTITQKSNEESLLKNLADFSEKKRNESPEKKENEINYLEKPIFSRTMTQNTNDGNTFRDLCNFIAETEGEENSKNVLPEENEEGKENKLEENKENEEQNKNEIKEKKENEIEEKENIQKETPEQPENQNEENLENDLVENNENVKKKEDSERTEETLSDQSKKNENEDLEKSNSNQLVKKNIGFLEKIENEEKKISEVRRSSDGLGLYVNTVSSIADVNDQSITPRPSNQRMHKKSSLEVELIPFSHLTQRKSEISEDIISGSPGKEGPRTSIKEPLFEIKEVFDINSLAINESQDINASKFTFASS